MKKFFSKKKRIAVVALLLCALVALAVGCGKSRSTPGKKPAQNDGGNKPAEPMVDEEYELLLGFENYREVVNTGLHFTSLFGKTGINGDKAYISQGEGSWMVCPEGDRGVSEWPTFSMRLQNLPWGMKPSIATDSFMNFDKILLDVYNASEKPVNIEWHFNIKKYDNDYADADPLVTTLKPGGWTTLEYDLSSDEFEKYFRLEDVESFTVKLLTKKENKDDVPDTLYFDNLRGHRAASEHKFGEMNYSFRDGIDFEKDASQRYLFTGGEGNQNNAFRIYRSAYSENTLKNVPKEFGKYFLKGECSNVPWPSLTMHFNETASAGDVVRFWVYVQVDPKVAEGKVFNVEAALSNTDRQKYQDGIGASALTFNEWHEVTIKFRQDLSGIWLYYNFEKGGPGGCFLGDSPVTVYMDNFTLETLSKPDFAKGVTFDKKDDYFAFSGGAGNETIALTREAYADTTLKNVPGEFGKYTLRGASVTNPMWPRVSVSLDKKYKAGQLFTFWVYAEADPALSAGKSYGINAFNTHSDNKRYWLSLVGKARYQFNTWNQITVRLNEDCEEIGFFFNLDSGDDKTSILGTSDNSKVTFYMDNFRISNAPRVDFTEGVTFEPSGEEFAFGGGVNHEELNLSRVAYADEGLTGVPSANGKYALKGETATNPLWPSVSVALDKQYKTGQLLTFWVYAKADPGVSDGKVFRVQAFHTDTGTREYVDVIGGSGLRFNSWYRVSIRLKHASKSMGFYFNFDSGDDKTSILGTSDNSKVTFYMDNFKVIDQPRVNFANGVTFEPEGDIYSFSNGGTTNNRLTLNRSAYAETPLGSAPRSDMGDYVLYGTTSNTLWPRIDVTFEKKYKAGQILTFWAYVSVDPAVAEGKIFSIAAIHDGENGRETQAVIGGSGLNFNRWYQVGIILDTDIDDVWFYVQLEHDPGVCLTGDAEIGFYVDNFKIIDQPEVDFKRGVGAEKEGDVWSFSGSHYLAFTREAYADTGLDNIPGGTGDYVFRGSANGKLNMWPEVDIKFDKTYKAGQILTFRLYAKADESWLTGQKFFKIAGGPAAGKQQSAEGGSRSRFMFNTWYTVAIPITEDSNFTWFYFNLDAGSNAVVTGDNFVDFYMDNFKVIDAPSTTFDGSGVTMEKENELYLFDSLQSDIAGFLSRAAYADSGITENFGNRGDYGLKVKGFTPGDIRFQVNFDKPYANENVFSFWIYVKADGAAADGKTYNVDIITTDSQKWYEINEPSRANLRFNRWNRVTIKLIPEDPDQYGTEQKAVQFRFRFDEAVLDSAEIYMDNFLIEPVPEADFEKGVGFENLFDRFRFSNTNGMGALNTSAYADEGINSAPEGGEHALKGQSKDSTYPQVTVDFGKTLKTGQVVTFWAYAGIDPAKAAEEQYRIESLGRTSPTDAFGNRRLTFNAWHKVSLRLKNDMSKLDFYFNLDDDDATPDNCRVPGETVTYYMDGFTVGTPSGAGIESGITFESETEESGEGFLFGRAGGNNASNSALFRAAYAEEGITQAPEGGEHALKLLAEGEKKFPGLTVNLGKSYPQGQMVTFYMYIKADNADGQLLFVSPFGNPKFDVIGGGYLNANEWTKVTLRLNAEGAEIGFYLELAGIASTDYAVYFDNFTTEPKAAYDYTAGVTLENESEFYAFCDGKFQGNKTARLSRAAYAEEGITPAPEGGAYALKALARGANADKAAVFNLKFEKPYANAKVVSFWIYVAADGAAAESGTAEAAVVTTDNQAWYTAANTGNAVYQVKFNTWYRVTSTLTPEPGKDGYGAEQTEVMVRVKLDALYGGATTIPDVKIYADNFRVFDNVKPDFTAGVGFENDSDSLAFAGGPESNHYLGLGPVPYDGEGITPAADGGKYVLRGTSSNAPYPNMHIFLDKQAKTGQVLSFWIYAKTDAAAAAGKAWFIGPDKRSPVQVYDGGSRDSLSFNGWHKITLRLTADASDFWIYYNLVDLGGAEISKLGNARIDFYMDNFVISENPRTFTEGLDFEDEFDGKLFAGRSGSNLLTLSRAAYKDGSVAAPADGGEYALKGTAKSTPWPGFDIKLDNPAAEGQMLAFRVYAKLDDTVLAESQNYNVAYKIEATNTHPPMVNGGGLKFNKWNLVFAALGADETSAFIYFNLDAGGGAVKTGDNEVSFYMDNFEVIDGRLAEQTGFEDEYPDMSLFTSTTSADNNNLLTLSRTAYEGSGIDPTEPNGGKYALKGTTMNKPWPALLVGFDKTYKAGQALDFWVYAKVDDPAAGGHTFPIMYRENQELPNISGGTYQFNKWNHVTLVFGKDVNKIWFYLQLGNEVSVWPQDKNVDFYFDNFKIISGPSFAEGAGLEGEGELPFFSRNIGSRSDLLTGLGRTAYAGGGVAPLSGFGDYALKGTAAAGATKPKFYIQFDRGYAQTTYFSFWVYVAGDKAKTDGKTYSANVVTSDNWAFFKGIHNTNLQYNTWNRAVVLLKDTNQDPGHSYPDMTQQVLISFDFSSAPDCELTVYADNFQVTETEPSTELPAAAGISAAKPAAEKAAEPAPAKNETVLWIENFWKKFVGFLAAIAK